MTDRIDTADEAVGKLEELDIAVTEAVAEQSRRPWVRVLGTLSEIGDQPPLRVLTLGTAAVGLWRADPKLTRTGVRMFAAHTLATLVKTAIKRSIDRTRPETALEDRYRMERGDSHEHDLTSFPSGHTAGALAVTQALARDYPQTVWPGLAFSAWVGAMQVPRCKHYVSDVAVGAAIGWASEQASSRLFDWAEEKLATSGS